MSRESVTREPAKRELATRVSDLSAPGASGTVLFLHASDEAYGADRILLDVVLGLRDRGWTPVVLLPDDLAPGWLSARLSAAGVVLERAPLAPARRRHLRLRGLPGFVRALLRARRHVRGRAGAHRALIVHVNTSALLVGALIGRPRRARLVWHVHEIVVRPRLLAWLFRLVPPLTADRVIAVSEAVRRHLTPAGRFRERVTTLRNGIPDRMPAPLAVLSASADQGPLVAYVGRLNRWKGYEIFIEAVGRIAARVPSARFAVAGDPPPGEEWRDADLEQRVVAAGITDRVTRLGFVEDGAAVLDAADIAVVPSTWPDPLPTVVLEAMRAGCAVIASNHGGAPEMIEDGVSGVLVRPADATALADAIEGLLRDPARRAMLGRAARDHVATAFSVERMVDEVDALYRDLLR